jgi:hypothetical protein
MAPTGTKKQNVHHEIVGSRSLFTSKQLRVRRWTVCERKYEFRTPKLITFTVNGKSSACRWVRISHLPFALAGTSCVVAAASPGRRLPTTTTLCAASPSPGPHLLSPSFALLGREQVQQQRLEVSGAAPAGGGLDLAGIEDSGAAPAGGVELERAAEKATAEYWSLIDSTCVSSFLLTPMERSCRCANCML